MVAPRHWRSWSHASPSNLRAVPRSFRMLTLEYWYLFPVSIVIATVAMASGIGGGVFFSPLFILALKLEPSVAVGTALITQLFGFSSALIAYFRRRLIDFRLGTSLLIFSLPAAVVGSLSANAVPADTLKGVFAIGMFFIGSQLYRSYREDEKVRRAGTTPQENDNGLEPTLVDRTGKEYRYTIRHKAQGRIFAGVGGALLGMISVGLAELQIYHLVARCNVPSAVAVATSIFVVVVTLFIASSGHFYHFATSTDPGTLSQVTGIVSFTAPGVLIGGQLGPLLQERVRPDIAKAGIAALFIAVGMLMLITLL